MPTTTMAGRGKLSVDKVLIIIEKNDLDDLKEDFRSIKESMKTLAQEIVELNNMVEQRVEDEQD